MPNTTLYTNTVPTWDGPYKYVNKNKDNLFLSYALTSTSYLT